MKKYLLLAAVAFALSLPASAEADSWKHKKGHAYGIKKNGDNGHHRCGGNSGNGIGNYCPPEERKYRKAHYFRKKAKGPSCDGKTERSGLDNGFGNGGSNRGHGNEGRGAYGRK